MVQFLATTIEIRLIPITSTISRAHPAILRYTIIFD